MSAGLAVSSSCEALHIICDSYIDKSLKEERGARRAINIASGELSIPDESTMQIEKCWVSSEKNNRLLQLIRKILVAHSLSVRVVLSGMVVIQEQVPAPFLSTDPTEPVMIPGPSRWFEHADERIVPHA